MASPYDPKSVANAFLNRGITDKVPIDPMKIQKLLYFAHGYYLAAFHRPLIDELFEVWPHGPVLPSLYQEFKEYRYSPISRLATTFGLADNLDFVSVPPPTGDADTDKCIEYVWRTYGREASTKLSRITHDANGPWAKAREENPFGLRNKDIPNEYIQDYFSRFVKTNAGAGSGVHSGSRGNASTRLFAR